MLHRDVLKHDVVKNHDLREKAVKFRSFLIGIKIQIQRHDVDEIECPVCNNTAKRIISLSSFELKGGGWYKDGYGSKKPESKPSPPKTSDGVTKAKPIKDE